MNTRVTKLTIIFFIPVALVLHGCLGGGFGLAEGMVPAAACVLMSANGMRFALTAAFRRREGIEDDAKV